MVDVAARGGVEVGVQRLGAPGAGLEVGATDRGAIDRIMDARFVKLAPQDGVFDLIERQAPAFHRDALRPPGAKQAARIERAAADVADGVDRVVLQDDLQRHGVVEIDPIGELLFAREA
jgi:hypothetical protein